jgi:hypothetical protein
LPGLTSHRNGRGSSRPVRPHARTDASPPRCRQAPGRLRAAARAGGGAAAAMSARAAAPGGAAQPRSAADRTPRCGGWRRSSAGGGRGDGPADCRPSERPESLPARDVAGSRAAGPWCGAAMAQTEPRPNPEPLGQRSTVRHCRGSFQTEERAYGGAITGPMEKISPPMIVEGSISAVVLRSNRPLRNMVGILHCQSLIQEDQVAQ